MLRKGDGNPIRPVAVMAHKEPIEGMVAAKVDTKEWTEQHKLAYLAQHGRVLLTEKVEQQLWH